MYLQLLGPCGHTRGPLGRASAGIHVQFFIVEGLSIQLLDHKRHFLRRAQIHKREAAKDGDRAALGTPQASAAEGAKPGRRYSPLPFHSHTGGGSTHTKKSLRPRLQLGWVAGIRRHVIILPLNTIWLHRALGFFHTTPPKSSKYFYCLENMSRSSFPGQPRLREVWSLTSSHNTEQRHYQK